MMTLSETKAVAACDAGQGFGFGGGILPVVHGGASPKRAGLVAQEDVRGESEQAALHIALKTGINGHDHDEHQHAEHHADQRDQGERGQAPRGGD